MLEVIVSRTNFIASHTEHKVRVVGLSTALANAKDLADWLEIKQVYEREREREGSEKANRCKDVNFGQVDMQGFEVQISRRVLV